MQKNVDALLEMFRVIYWTVSWKAPILKTVQLIVSVACLVAAKQRNRRLAAEATGCRFNCTIEFECCQKRCCHITN